MAKNFEHIIHKNSSAVVDGNPKLPTSGQLEYGEIAVNYAKDKETISLKNSNNEIVTFTSDKKLDNYVTVSDFEEAMQVASAALNDLEATKLEKSDFDNAMEDLETQLSNFYTKEEIDEGSLIVSASLNDLNTRLDSTSNSIEVLGNTKQDTLVSGTNIKTINNQSIIGSGNITIEGGSGGDTNVIETVKVNGTALTPDANKAVDIPVPKNVSDLNNDLNYIRKVALSDQSLLIYDSEENRYYDNHSIYSNYLILGTNNLYNVEGTYSVSFINSYLHLDSNEGEYPNTLSGFNAYIKNVLLNGKMFSSDSATDIRCQWVDYFYKDIQVYLIFNKDNTNYIDGLHFSFIGAEEISENGYTVLYYSALYKGYKYTLSIHYDYYNQTLISNPFVLKVEKNNIQSDWNATTGDAAILNKPNIHQNMGLHIEDDGYIVLRVGSQESIELDDGNEAITINGNEGINLNADKVYYNNKEVATVDQIVIPPVTSVNGQTGAVTVKENVQSDWNATTGDAVILNKPTIPTAVTESTVSGWGFTKNTGTVTSIKINGATKNPASGVVDLGTVLTSHQDISGKANTADLATVATSGSYNDLTNKPTIPSAPGTLNTTATAAQSTSASQSLSGNITLHKISKTGSYSDLNDKPTIPTVNDNTITLTFNGATVGTFTLNQNSNKTIDIGTIIGLPSFSAANNGQILGVVNGALAWITPTTIYTGSGTPSSTQGNDGDIYLQTS